MATNFYIDHYQSRNEQSLVEDLTIESIKFHGIDVLYIPRKIYDEDKVLGEDIYTKFKDKYLIEMYLDSSGGFEGDGDMLMNFGINIKDTATFTVSKQRFEDVVYNYNRPTEGDLVYFPLSNALFEINSVEHENPFYQLGKRYVYKLTCELFTSSGEVFETDYTDIDDINNIYNDADIIGNSDSIEIEDESNLIVKEDNNPKDHFLNVNEDDPFNGL